MIYKKKLKNSYFIWDSDLKQMTIFKDSTQITLTKSEICSLNRHTFSMIQFHSYSTKKRLKRKEEKHEE